MNYNYTDIKKIVRKLNKKKIIIFYKSYIKNYISLNKVYKFNQNFNKNYIFEQINTVLKNKIKKKLYLIPFGIKDVFNTKILKTSFGLNEKKNFKAGNNARVVDDIIYNQGIIFSKTTTAEFAVHFISKNKNINPYNKDHIVGTSSTGSALAVAVKALPVALGTQTGGSVLRPASYCGIYGMKPTFGLIDRTGVLKTNDLFDTVGILSNDLNGIKDILQLFSKFNKDYPWSINYNKNIVKFEKKNFFKIGIFDENFYLYKNFDKSIKDYLNNILNKEYNFKLIKIKQLNILSKIHYHHEILYKKSLYYYSKKSGLIFKRMGKKLINYIFQGKKISVNRYLESVKYKEFANKIFDRHFKNNYDFIIVPTTASIAPKHEQKEEKDTCLIWSFLGYPCISLPVYNKKIKNLPFGIMIVAQKYNDLSLIKFSRIIENKINVRK